MVDWVTLTLKIVELNKEKKYMLNEEKIHMFLLRGGIPLSGTIIYMTFFLFEKIRNYFICCESNPWLLPVVSLDPEVRLYRGRARVSFVEKRHEGAVHSGSLRGTGARAHDDADSHQ